MTIITQKFIYRSDLQNNPTTIYLFGDNEARVGLGGQAKEMRGEPNAMGIATKKDPGTFWSDDDLEANCVSLMRDLVPVFLAIKMGILVVIPEDGLGTGLSELPTRAPKTYAFLQNRLAELKSFTSF